MDKLLQQLKEFADSMEEMVNTVQGSYEIMSNTIEQALIEIQDINADLKAILVSPETQKMLDHLNSIKEETVDEDPYQIDKAIAYANSKMEETVDEDDDSADQPEPIERPELSENV